MIEEEYTEDFEVEPIDIPVEEVKTKRKRDFSEIEKLDLQAFNLSATMSHREVVRALGREEMFANMATAVADISRRINRVAKNPEKYGVSGDKAEQTKSIVLNRNSMSLNAKAREQNIKEVTKKEKKSIEVLTLEGSHKAWTLLNMKLDEGLRDHKKREKMALGEIAKVAGITFDKRQLIEGKATEHVAVMSKFDSKDITREQAMEAVLKMRELNEEQSGDQR